MGTFVERFVTALCLLAVPCLMAFLFVAWWFPWL